MKYSTILISSLIGYAYGQSASASASASGSSNGSDYGSGLLAALNTAGLTTLATLLTPLASQLVPVLQSQPFTVFAPTNAALAGVDTSNQTALADIIMYHVVYGTANATANNTIAATLLADTHLGNFTNQALVYRQNSSTNAFEILGQNATVQGNATYQNLLVLPIDSVLSIPGPLPVAIANPLGANASTLVGALSAVDMPLVVKLNSTDALTIFAPSDAAVSAIQSQLVALAGTSATAITDLVEAHILSQVVYSTNITDGLSATTLANGTLTLTVNSTGVFVMSNGGEAQVIATDFVAENGVVHTIDRVLLAPSNSSSASASASASA